METGEEVAEGSVWVCCGVGGAEGSRGQPSELTDLRLYQNTFVDIFFFFFFYDEEKKQQRRHVLRENIFTNLHHVMNICMIFNL